MRRCSDQLPTPSDGSPQGRDGELQTPRNSSIMQREREREKEKEKERERDTETESRCRRFLEHQDQPIDSVASAWCW